MLDGLLEEASGICVDDDCRPCFPVVDGLAHLHGIVIEHYRIHRHVAQVTTRLPRRYHFLRRLGDRGSYERSDVGIRRLCSVEINYEDIEGGEVLLDIEEDGPVHAQNGQDEGAEDEGYEIIRDDDIQVIFMDAAYSFLPITQTLALSAWIACRRILARVPAVHCCHPSPPHHLALHFLQHRYCHHCDPATIDVVVAEQAYPRNPDFFPLCHPYESSKAQNTDENRSVMSMMEIGEENGRKRREEVCLRKVKSIVEGQKRAVWHHSNNDIDIVIVKSLFRLFFSLPGLSSVETWVHAARHGPAGSTSHAMLGTAVRLGKYRLPQDLANCSPYTCRMLALAGSLEDALSYKAPCLALSNS